MGMPRKSLSEAANFSCELQGGLANLFVLEGVKIDY
jgi:hypothetical protein